jgi:hypothetical protein
MKRAVCSLFILVFASWFLAYSQNEKFKALFMYNFTKYIEWPASHRQGDFVIGVLGNSPLTKELETIAGKQKVGSQNIVVKTYGTVDEIGYCNVLYIPPSKSSQISFVVNKLADKSTLLITDKEGLALQGAGINYIMDGDKLKYEVNKNNIEKKGLTVSNALLTLGIVVSN